MDDLILCFTLKDLCFFRVFHKNELFLSNIFYQLPSSVFEKKFRKRLNLNVFQNIYIFKLLIFHKLIMKILFATVDTLNKEIFFIETMQNMYKNSQFFRPRSLRMTLLH